MATDIDRLKIIIEAENKATAAIDAVKSAVWGLAGAYISFQAVQAAFRAALNTVAEATRLASEQEQADVRLSAALENLGDSYGESLVRLKEFAGQMQRTTNYSDDQIQSAQALLISLGKLSGEGLDRATRASADLAAGLGIELTAAARLMAKAAAGSTEALGRYGLVLKEGLSDQEKFASLLEQIANRFGGQAAQAAQTFSGRVAEVKTQWDELLESFGTWITQSPEINAGLEAAAKVLADIATVIASAEFSEGIARFASGLASIAQSAADTAVRLSFGIFGPGFTTSALALTAAGLREVSGAINSVTAERDELAALTKERSLFGGFANTADLERWIELQDKLGVAIKEKVVAELDKAGQATERVVNTWYGLKIIIDETGKVTKEAIEEVEVLPNIMMEANENTDGILQSFDKMTPLMKEAAKFQALITEAADEGNRRIIQQNNNLEAQRAIYAQLIDRVGDLGASITRAALNGQTSFGEFFKQFFIEIAAAIVKALILAVIMTIIRGVTGGAGSFLGDFLGSLAGRGLGQIGGGGSRGGGQDTGPNGVGYATQIPSQSATNGLVINNRFGGGINEGFVSELLELQNDFVRRRGFRVLASEVA